MLPHCDSSWGKLRIKISQLIGLAGYKILWVEKRDDRSYKQPQDAYSEVFAIQAWANGIKLAAMCRLFRASMWTPSADAWKSTKWKLEAGNLSCFAHFQWISVRQPSYTGARKASNPTIKSWPTATVLASPCSKDEVWLWFILSSPSQNPWIFWICYNRDFQPPIS